MISKKIDEITGEDLKDIVENNVIEKKTMEYKSELPSNSDDSKKKFLAEVSSFANTLGGDLIYGIKEEEGNKLSNDLGIEINDIDSEILRLESIIREGISPRINTDVRPVDVGSNKTVLIIRVRSSMDCPHMVVFAGHRKFYGRSSNGKYPLDVDEIRNSVIKSSSIVDKIRNFRNSRISDIKFGITPVKLANNKSFISLHILPLSAFKEGSLSYKISSDKLYNLGRGRYGRDFMPLGWRSCNFRINLDGVTTYTPNKEGESLVYTQLYRDGRVEAGLIIFANGLIKISQDQAMLFLLFN